MGRKRKTNNKNRGSAFERSFCKELSLWWSDNKRDDLFWRTATSGGRATVRRKKGKASAGMHGDVQSVHPKSRAFTLLYTIELKLGYSTATLQDLLDKQTDKKGKKVSVFERFIDEAMREAADVTPAWLLVVKRMRRDPVLVMPALSRFRRVYDALQGMNARIVLMYYRRTDTGECVKIFAASWNDFRMLSAHQFRRLVGI